MRNLLKISLVTLFFFGPLSAKEDKYVCFVNKVSGEILQLLRNNGDSKSKEIQSLKKIMGKHFSMDSISKFVLGRYWRTSNNSQRKEFTRLFHEVLARDYSSQFGEYNDEEVIIHRSKLPQKGGIIVVGQINKPGAQPIDVHWLVREKANNIKIYDVIVAGVSMSQTLRNEYGTRFSQNNGMDGLLKNMKESIKG